MRRSPEPVQADLEHAAAGIGNSYGVTNTAIDLRTVAAMRREFVRLNLPVRKRVRVVAVRFVHMLGRKRRRKGEHGRHKMGVTTNRQSRRDTHRDYRV